MNMLIWFGFIALMILVNWFIIEKKNKKPSHPINATLTLIFSVLCFYWDTRPLLFCIPCALFTYWFLFDTGLNIARGKPIQYLGKDSVLDRIFGKIEGPIFWFKLILFVGVTGIYYADF